MASVGFDDLAVITVSDGLSGGKKGEKGEILYSSNG